MSRYLTISRNLRDAPTGSSGPATLRQLLGSQTDHGDGSAEIVARVLALVTKQHYEIMVSERLWKPMGGGELSFRRNGSNERRAHGATAGCCVTARIGDWMRVGELLANDGVFEGNQFTPPRYVTPDADADTQGVDGGFWHRRRRSIRGRGCGVARDGGQSQRLWMVPSLRLVILRVGDEPPMRRTAGMRR